MSTYSDILVSELPAPRLAPPSGLSRLAARVASYRAARRDQRMLADAMSLGHASANELIAAARRG